jgi:nucleobase transporter 1/2
MYTSPSIYVYRQLFFSQVQGAILVSSFFQMFIGFSGLIGFLLRFIGPVTVAPTITLIGLALFHVAAQHAG